MEPNRDILDQLHGRMAEAVTALRLQYPGEDAVEIGGVLEGPSLPPCQMLHHELGFAITPISDEDYAEGQKKAEALEVLTGRPAEIPPRDSIDASEEHTQVHVFLGQVASALRAKGMDPDQQIALALAVGRQWGIAEASGQDIPSGDEIADSLQDWLKGQG